MNLILHIFKNIKLDNLFAVGYLREKGYSNDFVKRILKLEEDSTVIENWYQIYLNGPVHPLLQHLDAIIKIFKNGLLNPSEKIIAIQQLDKYFTKVIAAKILATNILKARQVTTDKKQIAIKQIINCNKPWEEKYQELQTLGLNIFNPSIDSLNADNRIGIDPISLSTG